jgi:hypothetical protein
MKLRHNKKRNTAFIFEALVKEMTKNVIKKNDEKKKQIAAIIKEHFKSNSILGKELKLYQASCRKLRGSTTSWTSKKYFKSKAT